MLTRHLEVSPRGSGLLDRVREVAASTVANAADDVDLKSRFPSESIEVLRDIGALGALVPAKYGGLGCTVTDVAAICSVLGEYCVSSAMVYAMHNIQVACIVRHSNGSEYFEQVLRGVGGRGHLLASATSEVGIGGDIRSSRCAVERAGGSFTLTKEASVISYGAYADGILATARASADAAPNDQVLVHVAAPGLTLEQTGEWDALGMRGTCSVGFVLSAHGIDDQILPDSFGDIASRTMLPVSHLTWASLWVGIASGAMAKARAFVRAAARKSSTGQIPAAPRLVSAMAQLDSLRATLDRCLAQYERTCDDSEEAASIRWAVDLNNLKLLVSRGAFDVVADAMLVCGIMGYRNDTPFSIGRALRDSQSAALMVHNDRIMEHNAFLLNAVKDN